MRPRLRRELPMRRRMRVALVTGALLSSFGADALTSTTFAAHLASARPAAEPYLGLPSSSPVTTPDHWITVPAFPNLTFDDPIDGVTMKPESTAPKLRYFARVPSITLAGGSPPG